MREVELGAFDGLLELQPLACRPRGLSIAAVEDACEPIGIFGCEQSPGQIALRSCGGAPRLDDGAALGSMAGRYHLALGGMDAAQCGPRGLERVALGLPVVCGLSVFEGSLARPFQGSGYRSRPKSLPRSRSSQ